MTRIEWPDFMVYSSGERVCMVTNQEGAYAYARRQEPYPYETEFPILDAYGIKPRDVINDRAIVDLGLGLFAVVAPAVDWSLPLLPVEVKPRGR